LPRSESLHVVGLQDLVALLVDDLALVVGDVVVFEQLLADVEVARLDLALRLLDRARDACRCSIASPSGIFSRSMIALGAVAGEDAHQRSSSDR
jgi:hypothetical protein